MTGPIYDESATTRALYEVFESATREASLALCRWTNDQITVTLEQMREVPLEDVGAALEIGDEMLTMVVLTIGSDVGGNLVLLFDEPNARQLTASLLEREPATEPEWSDLEISALCETGNILGCAYINALTRFVGIDLIPSPPYFIQDYGASVVQQAAMTRALTSDRLLLCQIGFHCKGQRLDWRIVFIPTQGMQDAMQQPLQAAV